MSKSGPPQKNKFNFLRLSTQIFVFGFIAVIAFNQYLELQRMTISWLPTTCLHAICPFGGVETLFQLATTGTFVQKVDQQAIVLMYIVFGLSLLAGPLFCGWLCPLGSIQEWLSSAGRKIFGNRYNNIIPSGVDHILRYTRYLVAVLVIYATAISARLIFADYDPYHALFKFWSGEVAISALIILGIVLLLSLIIERPFCKYACPYGAILGLFNFFRIFQLHRNKSTCINCKACDRSCPMNIKVSSGTTIRDHQCISCLKCTSDFTCPVSDTVVLSTKKFQEPH